MTDAEPSGSTATTVDREAIRKELEKTRAGYHALLSSLADEDWTKKSGNPAWNVRQLMWHLAWALKYFPRSVEECRKGKGTNPPNWIMNPANTLITRFGARGASPQSEGEKYDIAHEKLIACLSSVQDDEWQKGVRSFGQEVTIESTFRSVTEHFQEHEADTKRGLGRS